MSLAYGKKQAFKILCNNADHKWIEVRRKDIRSQLNNIINK